MVRLALRGEKPILNHSTSLPDEGLLYINFPKPIIELPHIFASTLLIFFINLSRRKLSLRCCSFFTPLIKSSTLEVFSVVFTFANLPVLNVFVSFHAIRYEFPVRPHDAQRTGLCAGGEIEFRLPGTADD